LLTDLAGNALLAGASTSNYSIDTTEPLVTIARDDANPTNTNTVVFSVNFSEDVTHVDAADFTLVLSGVTADAMVTVGNGGDLDASTYTVTVNMISGDGTLGLNVADSHDITDLVTNALNTTPTTAEVYTIDNTAPVITAAQNFDVSEDAAETTSVGTVTANDTDNLQAWTIVAGHGDGIFSINADTGEITISDNTGLDREMTDTYVLTLTVGDGVNTSDTETVTIHVTDVNDNAPVITAGQSFDVGEHAANSTSLGTVFAADADITGSLENWIITAGNGDGIFSIDNHTGEISIVDNTNLDYETTVTYVLTITVGDGANISAATLVTINVMDVNESTPMMTATQSLNVAEDAADIMNVDFHVASLLRKSSTVGIGSRPIMYLVSGVTVDRQPSAVTTNVAASLASRLYSLSRTPLASIKNVFFFPLIQREQRLTVSNGRFPYAEDGLATAQLPVWTSPVWMASRPGPLQPIEMVSSRSTLARSQPRRIPPPTLLGEGSHPGRSLNRDAFGPMLEVDLTLEKYHAKINEWYIEVTEKGLDTVQLRLAAIYHTGERLEQDLAHMYEKGQTLQEYYKEAKEWYNKAAEKGLAIAMRHLSAICSTGQGDAEH
jgi:hypothetical protein